METFLKTLPKRHRTKKEGIYYKEIQKTTVDDHGKENTSITDTGKEGKGAKRSKRSGNNYNSSPTPLDYSKHRLLLGQKGQSPPINFTNNATNSNLFPWRINHDLGLLPTSHVVCKNSPPPKILHLEALPMEE